MVLKNEESLQEEVSNSLHSSGGVDKVLLILMDDYSITREQAFGVLDEILLEDEVFKSVHAAMDDAINWRISGAATEREDGDYDIDWDMVWDNKEAPQVKVSSGRHPSDGVDKALEAIRMEYSITRDQAFSVLDEALLHRELRYLILFTMGNIIHERRFRRVASDGGDYEGFKERLFS